MPKINKMSIIKYVPAIATFLIGVGLQISGIVIPWLGYSIIVLGISLLLIPGWPLIKRMTTGVRKTCSNIARLRLTLKPVREHKDVKTRFLLKADEELEKCKQELAAVEEHIVNAENAIAAGNVKMWLDCRMGEFDQGWWGLQRDTKPYFVVEIDVTSRLVYGLSFSDAEHVNFGVRLDVDQNQEAVFLDAMLIETQSDWKNVNEKPELSNADPHIKSLWVNALYFRMEVTNDIRNKIIRQDMWHKVPRLQFTADWTLRSKDNREVSYSMSTLNLNLKPVSEILAAVRNLRLERGQAS